MTPIPDHLGPTPPPLGAPRLPHSRACGITPHPHGRSCHSNCPVCEGKPLTDEMVQAYLAKTNQTIVGDASAQGYQSPPHLPPLAKQPMEFTEEEVKTLKRLAEHQLIVTSPPVFAKLNPSAGVEFIAAERQRQVDKEGYRTTNDAWLSEHNPNMLARAAACYALPSTERSGRIAHIWPWPREAWKPTPEDRIRELAKAGALIAAEIDRLIYLEEQIKDV